MYFILYFLPACVQFNFSVDTCMCWCVYMCVWRLGDDIMCLFQSLFTLSFEAGSLPEFGVYWLARWLARVLPPSPPTNTSWCHTCKQSQLTFNCGVRGSELKSVCFCGKHFISWVISTVTVVLILTKGFFPWPFGKKFVSGPMVRQSIMT